MKSAVDIKGDKFGLLTVIERNGTTPAGHATWICKCKCGNICTRTATSLKRSENSSCGCYRAPYEFRNKNRPHSGCGEISAGWFYDKVGRSATVKRKGKFRKKVTVDVKYLWELFLKQDRRCALTGLELTFPKNSSNKSYKESTASLDRVDSKKGYTKDNVQFVHKDVNMMKRTYNQDYFINICKLIAEYNK